MDNSTNLFKHKISGASGFVLVLLVLVLVGLGERVLYDLSRIFVGDNFNYFDDLATLIVHTLFVVPLIIIAVIASVTVTEKREKYAVVLIPYFVMAIALTLQVALEATFYFYGHHTMFQFYLVMSTLVVISSMLIYFIQKRYVPPESTEERSHSGQSFGAKVIMVIGGFLLLLFIVINFFFRTIF
ncbi:MAG: hypothetical protein Q8P69_00365 [bacterium]|nr:hypothetical protein [bacterium]